LQRVEETFEKTLGRSVALPCSPSKLSQEYPSQLQTDAELSTSFKQQRFLALMQLIRLFFITPLQRITPQRTQLAQKASPVIRI
jgi:hypothetical protein